MSDLSEIWRAEMVSVEDIASLWKVPRIQARDVIVKMVGFPAPAPGSTPKFKRWRLEDVLKFRAGDPA